MKLAVNQSGDEYEQEADRVADRAIGPTDYHSKPRTQDQPLRGEALPHHTQHYFKSRMGHDFSDVRIHDNREAAQSAKQLNAKAYTVGRDIVFDEGEYSPETREGKKLLAHELAHVVQQHSSFVRVQRQPKTKDKMQKLYDITIEKGDKDWSAGEIKILEAALARLSTKERAIVKGYKFVRWSTPGARKGSDTTYIQPGPGIVENCYHEYAPGQGIFRITAYDSCFSDPEAENDLAYGIDKGEFNLLHEIGHAGQFAKERQAYLTKGATSKAYLDVRGKAFDEFKKLMKGKKIIATAVTTGTKPSDYTDADYQEAFAETFAAAIANPKAVEKEFPDIYKWMKDNKYL